jgi:nucleotide-binding universal stress UspA family protein
LTLLQTSGTTGTRRRSCSRRWRVPCWLDLQTNDAQGYLDALAAQLRTAGVPVTTEVRRGDPATALSDEAAEPGVGLVVVATHGRAGLQATWVGSVTAWLLARTRTRVLLLRTIDR